MIEGVPIPHWSQLCDSLLRLANRVSFLPYLGWDIAVSPEGIRAIEINGNTGLDMLQLERPLLIDKRLRQFYVAHGSSEIVPVRFMISEVSVAPLRGRWFAWS